MTAELRLSRSQRRRVCDRQSSAGARALRAAIRLRASPKRSGQMSLEDAAELLDISPAQMWRLQRGVSVPSLRLAARIETEFGIGVRLWLQ